MCCSCIHRILIRQGQIPIRARETPKRGDEGEEDGEEDDVGAQAADEEDDADEAHEEQEEGEAGVEGGLLLAERVARVAHRRGDFGGGGDVGTVGVEPGD